MKKEKRKRTKNISIATIALVSILLATCMAAAPAMAQETICWNDTFDDETRIAEKQGTIVKDGDVEMDIDNASWLWQRSDSLVSGLSGGCRRYFKPAIAFNITGDGRWNLIYGVSDSGAKGLYGYYWGGSQWISNSSLVAGIGAGDVGDYSAPALAFNITGDGKWNMISGESGGIFHGFYWNGSLEQWISDSSLVAGLGDVGSYSVPAMAFNITGDGRWNLISGDWDGKFHGFNWNGSQWVNDSSLVPGLDVGNSNSAPTIAFNITTDGKWWLISGHSGEWVSPYGFYGWYWNGTHWISYPSFDLCLWHVEYIFRYKPAIAFNITGDGAWNMICGGGGYSSGWSGYELILKPGSVKSVLIQPSAVKNWAVFNANDTVPMGTSITYKILDASNNTIMSVVDGQDISSIAQTSIRLYAELATNDISKTPVLHDWSVCWKPNPPNPDLTPTAINAPRLFVDQSNTVSATIANIGVVDATSFNVSLSANGIVVDNASVPLLSAGNTTAVSLNWTPALLGNYDLCVVADPDNAIEEMDETNNEECISVTVENIGWRYGAIMPWDIERLSDGNTLIAEHGNHTVIEVTPAGEIAWIYGTGTPGSEPGQLNCPMDAERLTNGNTLITDRMNERVIEVNPSGEIVWQYGTTGVWGNGINQLRQPRDAERLENGNTLITDRLNNRVIEVRTADYPNFTAGSIVWQVTGINHPADAELLPNGNMLIVVYKDHTVIEINTATKKIVWQYGTTGTEGSGINQLNYPEAAERLPNGNTLIADRMNNRIIEVTPANIIIRQYGTGIEGSGENELKQPADAERLSIGSTLIADTGNNRVIEVATMPSPAPMVLSFAPPSPVYDAIGVVRTFSITIDQVVDVEWQINGGVVKNDVGVAESSYPCTAQEGTWTVSAIASNANGTDMQQWDWTVVSALGPDLIVSMINAYHNNTGCPAWFNLSNEVDVTVTNIGTEPVRETSVSLYIEDVLFGKLGVPGLDAGTSATVTFENWKPIGEDCLLPVCEFTWPHYKEYNFTAIADCDNKVRKESNETNNEATVVDRACYNGYMADEPLENVAHGMLHGGLLFTTGDGVYGGLYSVGSTQVTNYDITIPDGAAVELAHLNVYYTWTKPGGVCPEMDVSITTPGGTTHNTLPLMKAYNDVKCTCPGASWVLTWGNYVYNVTDYIDGSGTYTVTVKNNCIFCTQFCPAAPGLTIIYEDESAPLIEYWINNGADILMGARRYPTSSNLAWWENINNATFPASTETREVVSATLGVVSPWSGSSWAPGTTNYLFFNDVKLGEGVYHDKTYDETIDSITMHIGSINAQVGVNVTDVTALYLKGSDNVVGQADDGDNGMPSNAFLVVEYPVEYGVSVTIDEVCKKVLPGENTSYTVRVRNTGIFDASYEVTLSGTAVNESTIDVSKLNWNTTGNLTSGSEDVTVVNVSTTEDTPGGTYNLTATAVCDQKPNVTDSDTVKLEVAALPIPPDFLVGNQAGNVELFMNSNGTFVPQGEIADVDGALAWGLASGDFNGDGYMDFIVGDNAGQVELFLGHGFSSSFTSAEIITVGGEAYGLTSGDYDNNGSVDFIVGNGAGELKLFLNDGAGAFNSAGVIEDIGDHAWALTSCDFNGDGDIDFISGDYDGTLKLFTNDGTGNFASSTIADIGNETYGVTSGDYDNDCDCDFLATANDGEVKLFKNNGDGSFTDCGTVISLGEWRFGLESNDFDADGDIDVLGETSDDTVNLYKNDGSGNFVYDRVVAASPGQKPRGLASGNFVMPVMPDLTVTRMDIPIILCANVSNVITATIENIGNENAGAFDTTLYADGSEIETKTVSALNADASTKVSFSWTPAHTGSYTLRVMADSTGAIAEFNESNNDMTKAVTAAECVLPPAPCMINGYVVYENRSKCNGSSVNVTNTNTSSEWPAETNTSCHYYELVLDSYELSAENILRFNATDPDATQKNVTDHTVTQDELNDGGLFGFNLTLMAVAVNQPPVADAGPDQTAIVNETVTFNGSGSYDPDTDGTIVSYEWEFGDGNITNTTGAIITHVYTIAKTYTVNLTVTDNEGATGTDTALVNVSEAAIQAGVTFNKKRLDLNSNEILNAFITLPDGYNVTQINVSTVECEGASAELEGGGVIPGKDTFEVKFKIQDMRKDLPIGDNVKITVTGELYDGTPFECSNTLKVVRSGKPPK